MAIPRLSDKEKLDAQVEYVKYLTTLSTGAIVILVSFLDRIVTQPAWIGLIGISLCGFLVTILFNLFMMLVLAANAEGSIDGDSWIVTLANWANFLGFFTFLIALVCLVVFAFKNIL